MNVKTTPLAGLLILEPNVFTDQRGYFFESYKKETYAELGIPPFLQDNVSRSKQNSLRGLHYQQPPHAQGKLVGVTKGVVWDVAVDIRASSPTFGQWYGLILSDENHTQLYIPPGFAHGFCVLSEHADFYYKCTNYYAPTAEYGIAWDDKRLNITWPVTAPILSPKDMTYPCLHEMNHDQLFA